MIWPEPVAIWQAVFAQAWLSWTEGNFGIGAALVEPGKADSDGASTDSEPTIVSLGRNMVASGPTADQPLAGNYVAHAEMNAFAAMSSYSARGLHLFSTLEPCLMCGAAAIFLNVSHVSYASADEFFGGMHTTLWPHHAYTATRVPPMEHAISGPLATFARLLPMEFTLQQPDSNASAAARQNRPRLAAVIEQGNTVARLRELAESGASVTTAIEHLWTDLAGLD